jgi:hypothetical protein
MDVIPRHFPLSQAATTRLCPSAHCAYSDRIHLELKTLPQLLRRHRASHVAEDARALEDDYMASAELRVHRPPWDD